MANILNTDKQIAIISALTETDPPSTGIQQEA